MNREKVQQAFALLKKTYPNAKIVLKYRNPWELLVAVVLSAQCTDVMVNKVTQELFVKYRTFDDYLRADVAEFERDIKPTGFFRNKAKNILAAARLIKEKFGGVVPKTMEEMLMIPGVGRKTANVVLGNAYGVVEGIAVDTHVLRVSQRLGLVGKRKNADPVKIERELIAIVPKSDWFSLTYLLIDHGRSVCRAKNPNCGGCVLNKLCPSSRV